LTDLQPIAPDLSVVMPVYNEAVGVGPVILSWIRELDRLGIHYEFLVYDDGSRDNTLEVLTSIAHAHPGVVAQRHPNMGHGPTISRGYREATGEWVFQIDSDDEMSPAAFEAVWNRRHQADLVLGCRRNRQSPPARRIISGGSRLVVRLLFGHGLWDVNTPFRLIRRSMLNAMLPRIPADTFAPNVIMSGLALRDHLRIDQVWVPHEPRKFGTASIVGWKQWKTAARCVSETLNVALSTRMPGRRVSPLPRDAR
jgi:glycosyltransferase involved in cell wall biosynthesis